MENALLSCAHNGKPMILGTDWHTDCDDVVALRIVLWAHRHGIIKLLGISIDSVHELSYKSMLGFLEYEKTDGIAVGIDLNACDYGGPAKYHAGLAALSSKEVSNDDGEDAVHMYRRLIADAAEKVDIMEIGFSQVLADVLMSEPDALSPLNGIELFRAKVNKLWIMGGDWNTLPGKEFNFSKTEKASRAISKVLSLCPVPVALLGLEVGKDVKSGAILKNCATDDALYNVLCDWGACDGRSSWDPMLVYLACVGDAETAGYYSVKGTANVDPVSGCNNFFASPNGRHEYVVKKYADSEYEKCLDEIILKDYEEIKNSAT